MPRYIVPKTNDADGRSLFRTVPGKFDPVPKHSRGVCIHPSDAEAHVLRFEDKTEWPRLSKDPVIQPRKMPGQKTARILAIPTPAPQQSPPAQEEIRSPPSHPTQIMQTTPSHPTQIMQTTRAEERDDKQGVSAWWRYQKASALPTLFGDLREAVGNSVPPRLPYPKELCSHYTYTSQAAPVDLLTSLCLALVYADVTISNQAELLAGNCWTIRGFFFAMYCRTCVQVSVFTSEKDGQRLVEVQLMQGDRGACNTLCGYLQTQCSLSDDAFDTQSVKPVTRPTAHTKDTSNARAAMGRTWGVMRGCALSPRPPPQMSFQNKKAKKQEYFQEPKDLGASLPSLARSHGHTAAQPPLQQECRAQRPKGLVPTQLHRPSASSPTSVSRAQPPSQPLNLHLCDSYKPLPLPPGLVKRRQDEGNTYKELMHTLLTSQADTEFYEAKLTLWQDIARLTATEPDAAQALLSLCVESCSGNGETWVLGSMAKLLQANDEPNHDLQYCVLASFFHAVQTAQRDPLSLLDPNVLCPMASVVRVAAKFRNPRYGRHLRVHAVGLLAWFTCQQAAASISCGAALSIALPQCIRAEAKKLDDSARVEVESDSDWDRLHKIQRHAGSNEIMC